jgi:hypothetical protein
VPEPQPAAALRACAAGLYHAEAACELLIATSWPHRADFRDGFIHAGISISDGATAMASIDWAAAVTALAGGQLPCSDLLTELRDVSAAQKVEPPCRSVTTLTGMSRSACRGGRDLDLSATESGHSVLNDSPASSSLLLVNTSLT